MGAGAFAALEQLQLGVKNREDGDAVFATLVGGLVDAPCARTLRSLVIHDLNLTGSGPGLDVLGAAIRGGRLPAFVKLCFPKAPLEDEPMARFLSSFTPQTPFPLEALELYDTRIGDKTAAALAKALSTGCLGSGLREVYSDDHRTVRALVMVAKGTGEPYVRCLEVWDLGGLVLPFRVVVRLVRVVVKAFPALKRLEFNERSAPSDKRAPLREYAARIGKPGVLRFVK